MCKRGFNKLNNKDLAAGSFEMTRWRFLLAREVLTGFRKNPMIAMPPEPFRSSSCFKQNKTEGRLPAQYELGEQDQLQV